MKFRFLVPLAATAALVAAPAIAATGTAHHHKAKTEKPAKPAKAAKPAAMKPAAAKAPQ